MRCNSSHPQSERYNATMSLLLNETVLEIATLLGGISGGWFLIDKLAPRMRSITHTEPSSFASMLTSATIGLLIPWSALWIPAIFVIFVGWLLAFVIFAVQLGAEYFDRDLLSILCPAIFVSICWSLLAAILIAVGSAHGSAHFHAILVAVSVVGAILGTGVGKYLS
jgi:hypothetical protein